MWQDRLKAVQAELKKQKLDGWLFYDFRRTNELACDFLLIPADAHLTRRFFYFVPENGEPIKLAHRIEPHVLSHLPGELRTYSSWQELETQLNKLLQGKDRVAMEYSPGNALPYVSKVDAGTIERVRGCGVEIVSSADLLQLYTSRLSPRQIELHLQAADVVNGAVAAAWELIEEKLIAGQTLTELQVQQFILNYFKDHDCVTDGPPIVATNAHAADPHYCPSPDQDPTEIHPGDFILIDLWCKKKDPEAVFADITRVGVAGAEPTAKQQEVFSVVKQARDEACELVKRRFASDAPVYGYEVDACARKVITDAGYGEYFTHRTGHNIFTEPHGPGTHMDDLETRDMRQIQTGTCFSIEPGIYLPGEFGVRMEYDVLVTHDGEVRVTGGEQQELRCLAVQTVGSENE